MDIKIHPYLIIKSLIVLYLLDVYSKAYLSIPLAPVLDVFLMLVVLYVMQKGVPGRDLIRLLLVFVSALLLATKLTHGITLNTLVLILTSRALLMIFITIFLAVYYIRLQPDLDVIIRFIENIIAILIVFIVLDGVYINFIGSAFHLIALFEPAGYVYLGNSPFFDFVPQGLVPGAQHASIISCAGIILFFPSGRVELKRMVLFILSVIGLAFSVTNTALVAFVLAILIGYFVASRINFRSFYTGIGLLVIILFAVDRFYDWLVIRYGVLEGADQVVIAEFINRYIEIFLSPLVNMKSLPFSVLLTGVGHFSFESVTELLVNEYSLAEFNADFGYLMMIFSHGVVNVLMLTSVYIGFLLYVKKNIRYVFDKERRKYIAKIVAVVSLFAASGAHYMTPGKPGLMQIIILLAAITVIMIQRYIYQRNKYLKRQSDNTQNKAQSMV